MSHTLLESGQVLCTFLLGLALLAGSCQEHGAQHTEPLQAISQQIREIGRITLQEDSVLIYGALEVRRTDTEQWLVSDLDHTDFVYFYDTNGNFQHSIRFTAFDSEQQLPKHIATHKDSVFVFFPSQKTIKIYTTRGVFLQEIPLTVQAQSYTFDDSQRWFNLFGYDPIQHTFYIGLRVNDVNIHVGTFSWEGVHLKTSDKIAEYAAIFNPHELVVGKPFSSFFQEKKWWILLKKTGEICAITNGELTDKQRLPIPTRYDAQEAETNAQMPVYAQRIVNHVAYFQKFPQQEGFAFTYFHGAGPTLFGGEIPQQTFFLYDGKQITCEQPISNHVFLHLDTTNRLYFLDDSRRISEQIDLSIHEIYAF